MALLQFASTGLDLQRLAPIVVRTRPPFFFLAGFFPQSVPFLAAALYRPPLLRIGVPSGVYSRHFFSWGAAFDSLAFIPSLRCCVLSPIEKAFGAPNGIWDRLWQSPPPPSEGFFPSGNDWYRPL